MRTVEFNMAPQRIKFEEELIALQATVDSTTRQNDVKILNYLQKMCINYVCKFVFIKLIHD